MTLWWRHHYIIQNQITVIVYSIFLKCLNKVPCIVNGGFYPPQRLMCFENNVNKTDTSCNMFSHCCCRTTLPHVPKNVFSQKFIKLFFPWILWVRWRKRQRHLLNCFLFIFNINIDIIDIRTLNTFRAIFTICETTISRREKISRFRRPKGIFLLVLLNVIFSFFSFKIHVSEFITIYFLKHFVNIYWRITSGRVPFPANMSWRRLDDI